ncbi:hypothetical protein BT67DRAFT_253843 [Trichocladium antarcticum]|uniref:Uncharacterized protein n=1 Tax=Trichocladium antarcticum TaxID=1450529 RepID=A0AAN6ZEN4_9PEZI|nr:hypothetical protein BT67DRAFT_253843 [Trichocladium antarcticum]
MRAWDGRREMDERRWTRGENRDLTSKGVLKGPSCVEQEERKDLGGEGAGGRSISTFHSFRATRATSNHSQKSNQSRQWAFLANSKLPYPLLLWAQHGTVCNTSKQPCLPYRVGLWRRVDLALQRGQWGKAKELPMRVEHLQPPRADTVRVWDQTVCQNWFSQRYPCVGRNSGSSPFPIDTVRCRKIDVMR